VASKYWLKLYYEILDDPKMGRLPDKQWRRVIEFFLMAGEVDQEGILPPPADMAWRLRITEDELMDTLMELENIGILTDAGEHWIVTRFAARQAPVDNAERQRRYRDRQRKTHYYGDAALQETVTDGVTRIITTPVTKRNTDTDTDTEEDKGAAAPSSFDGWLRALRTPGSMGETNGIAVLVRMGQRLYEHFPADGAAYGRVGKLAKKAGSQSKLARVFWDNASKPLAIPLDYLTSVVYGRSYEADPGPPIATPTTNYQDPDEFFAGDN